jgi:hypothetical protein
MSEGNSNRPAPLWSKKVTDSRGKIIFLDVYSGQYGPYLSVVDSKKKQDGNGYERVRLYYSAEMTHLLGTAFSEAVEFFARRGAYGNGAAPAANPPPASAPASSAPASKPGKRRPSF